MSNPHKHIARLGIFLFQISGHSIGQRSISSLVSLDYLTSPFGDNNDMIILVKYYHSQQPTVLLHAHSAVNLQHLTGDVRAVVRYQEQRSLGNLLYLSSALQGN